MSSDEVAGAPGTPGTPGTAPSDWRTQLRQRGYRLTPQRELVLEAVDTLGHATPDEVHAEVRRHASAVNVSTVYRALEVLEDLGLVRHTHLSDRAPTYHSVSGHEHVHLVCRRCRRTISVDAEVVSALTDRLRAEHGFVADVGHLTVFGEHEHEDCDAEQESEHPADHGHRNPGAASGVDPA